MGEVTRDGAGMTVGLDLGDRYSHLCVLDEHGEVCEEGRIATTAPALRKRFEGMARCLVVIEVGTHSPWVQRLLEVLGHEVITAHTQSVRLIYGGKNKNDRLDAERLARLARVDRKLLHPIRHREGSAQADRAVLRSRDALVTCRTKLINHTRGVVKSIGARLASGSAESFHKRAFEELPEELKPALHAVIETIAALTRDIHGYDKRIGALASKQYPETGLLRQVSGVGPVTALSFVLTVEDPRRFRRSRSLGAYIGLQPRRSQSGNEDPELRITKAGDDDLRRLLVGSAHYILGPFGPDTDLRRWGLALAARGRKNAKKRAIVAVARKLAVLLHRLWITAEVYEPLRNCHRRADRHDSVPQAIVG
jgi:transposase